MAVTYGFYNSVSGDRVYDSLQMSKLFDGLINDGVYASIGTAMVVVAGTGLQVVVGEGRAWFQHTWTLNDAPLPLSIDSPDVILNRIDTIVLEVNASEEVRANTIKVVKGELATTPVPPTLTWTEYIHQYPLAYVSVPVGLTAVTSAQITSMVGTMYCPFVTGVNSSLNVDALIADLHDALEADFNDWMASLEGPAILNNRQGGSGTNWSTNGVTNHTPASAKIQCGSALSNTIDGIIDITFPVAFSQVPLVFFFNYSNPGFFVEITSLTTSGFEGVEYDRSGDPAVEGGVVFWMAIGET